MDHTLVIASAVNGISSKLPTLPIVTSKAWTCGALR